MRGTASAITIHAIIAHRSVADGSTGAAMPSEWRSLGATKSWLSIPRKARNPTELALSAIQDALNIRDADAKAPGAAVPDARDNANDMRTGAPRSPGSPGAAREALDAPLTTPGGEEEEMTRAANDDRATIGQIMQSLQRRPAGTAFIIASLFAATSVICALGLIYGFWGQLSDLMHGVRAVPTVIGLLAAFSAPIMFFYAAANMVARSNELRIVANSMAEAALRFAEPDTIARDAIVTIGQAIRREVAAIGDGVERALARAAELETLVNNEVGVLERAYNDNEIRIRNLLDDLAQQRETLVGEAEHVHNAITNVHLDLSHDITTVSELIAERVDEAAQRVTRSLVEKGEQITVALGTAGDAMIEQLGERGTDLLERLKRTSDDTTQAIDAASDRLTSSLNFKSDHLNAQFLVIATNLQQSLASRLDSVVDGFSQKRSSVLEVAEARTREITQLISEPPRRCRGRSSKSAAGLPRP